MTTLREAAQQALEAMLRSVPTGRITLSEWYKAISDLAGAACITLEQPAQEPVAYADEISFRDAMRNGKGHDVWPKAGDYEQRTGRKLVALTWATPPRAAPQQPASEPVREMPSNTRFTVHVEGRGNTYYDCIDDAITYAQKAVYASVDATTRAFHDLEAGRVAEWSYGFSAVRIYPPQRKPLTEKE